MTFTDEQKAFLAEKLDKKRVATREQGRSSVSYIESWWAIAEANRIFGFDGWSRETVSLDLRAEHERKIGEGKPWEKDGWGVTYTAKVRVTVGDIVREGVGAGHGIDADLGQAHESAIKEAESDSAKRALMTFGWPFGLALYDKSKEHVEAKPNGTTIYAGDNPVTADDLIERLRMAKTAEALAATWQHVPFQHDLASLTGREIALVLTEKDRLKEKLESTK